MRSERWRTAAMSCAMKSNVSPCCCCSSTQQVQDLRLDRDVERADRLVADDQLGPQRERARDADALALAARELVRVAADRARLQADLREQLLHRARAAPRPTRGRRCAAARRRSLRPSCADRGCAYGSWKIICIRLRSARSSRDGTHAPEAAAPEPGQLDAVEARRCRAVGWSSCRSARPAVDLPQPLSPTRPSVSPRARSRSMPSTRAPSRAAKPERAAHREVHRERARLEQRAGLLGHGSTPRGLWQCRWCSVAAAPSAPDTPRSHKRKRARAARLERAAAGVARQVRRQPRDDAQRRACAPLEARDAREQPAVYGCAGALNSVVGRRGLDDAPGVHDQHAVGHARDDAQVVGDEHDARARLALQLAGSAPGSAPGWSRRARSSARRRSARPARTAAPSRSSRAGACRRRARADTRRSGARPRRCRLGQHLAARACAPPCGPSLRCSSSTSVSWRPTVRYGLSAVSGSWKIIEMRLPRSARSSPSLARRRSWPR